MSTKNKIEDKVYKIRIKKGDTVIVTAGKYKGKTGKVTATHPRENKVTVEGINIVKKAMKPTRAKPQGGFVELTKPMWVSKVAIVEPTSKKPSRIGYEFAKDGTKVRVFKKTGKEIK
ncbi:MAG TPA: 50S ribosomal protein L24 [Candidatus Saccharimonadales bacterium]|nr:50S ribosomal protein L24 [Candidatus Saccharimonadales bacterium]